MIYKLPVLLLLSRDLLILLFFCYRAFGGYASGMDFTMEAVAMAQAIGDSSAYVQGHYYNNGYDSPYKFWDRRNEVMFVAN